jgi:hypothetical protein
VPYADGTGEIHERTDRDHQTWKAGRQLLAADNLEDDFIGRLEGVVRIGGDIESPLVPLGAWDALK